MKMIRLLAIVLLFGLTTVSRVSAQTINATWDGDAVGLGNWSVATYWNPDGVPNNGGGNVFNVIVPFNPASNVYPYGPGLDINATIVNLTVDSGATLNGVPGKNLMVTGSTELTPAGINGGVLWVDSATFTLGTLTNFNPATQTLTGANMEMGGAGPTVIRFHGANIVTNDALLVLLGPNSRFLNQDNGANALANLAVNNGLVQFGDGANFTTAGAFTNNGLVGVTNFFGGLNTTVTLTSLTNYNAATHTLTGGQLQCSTLDNTAAIVRFGGADVRTIQNAEALMIGANARITDLNGNDAFRNLGAINGGNFQSNNGQTLTPGSGTFTNNGGTHTIDNGATVTVAGNLQNTNGGTTRISAPTGSANTTLNINGSALINGGSIDMGGQPGVNTQYHSELRVMNGLEFRGGAFTGTGTTYADIAIMQSSTLSPGHSAGQLTVQGALNLDSTTTLEIQIGGLAPGEGFDQVAQSGGLLTLGGTLNLSFIDGFENSITNSDTFDIVTSNQTLSGSFANVASGARLTTSDGIGSFLVTYSGQQKVRLSNFQLVLNATAAVSRQTHGAAGTFDVNLPLTGEPGVECRRSGGNHTFVFTFTNDIASGNASVTAGGGSVAGSPVFAGKTMSVNLTGVADVQKITVTLSNVTDTFAQVLPNTPLSVNMLMGDTNGSKTVSAADIGQTKGQAGSAVTVANFREDVTPNGSITASDVALVKSNSGHSLP